MILNAPAFTASIGNIGVRASLSESVTHNPIYGHTGAEKSKDSDTTAYLGGARREIEKVRHILAYVVSKETPCAV